MTKERQILHYLACRLRWARQLLHRARTENWPVTARDDIAAAGNEAHNAFQGAKRVYYGMEL